MFARGEFPATLTVEVGEVQRVVDEFGDAQPTGEVTWARVDVFGWAVASSDESQGDSISRVRDRVDLYVPPDVAPHARQRVRLPDGSVWDVEGDPENYENNPWWQPGLVVCHLYRARG